MSDKFSLYQTDGLWGIIENASNEKQTSIKSYFGSDLIIKRLNEQADQNDQLKQQNEELMLQLNRQNVEEHKPAYCTLAGTECEYLGNVDKLKQQLKEKDKEIEMLNHTLNLYNLRHKGSVLPNVNQLAIQELEKVKNKIEKRNNGTNNANYSTQYKDGYSSCCCDIEEQIDQQIKELKGEKDVED